MLDPQTTFLPFPLRNSVTNCASRDFFTGGPVMLSHITDNIDLWAEGLTNTVNLTVLGVIGADRGEGYVAALRGYDPRKQCCQNNYQCRHHVS